MTMLWEKINEDLVSAMKRKDDVHLRTLRLLVSAMQNREIEKKGKGEDPLLSDEEILGLIRREAKKRKEAAALYVQGGRAELAAKEEEELRVLESYLPPEPGEDVLRAAVDAAIAAVRPAGMKDFGRVMGAVMKETGGGADAALVQRIIKEKLGQ